MKALFACLLALLASGCLVQGGPRFGATVHAHEDHTEATWGGALVSAVDLAHYDLPAYLPNYVGGELTARSEHAHGSLLLGGVQVGRSFDGTNVHFAVHVDAGLTLGWSSVPTWYVGPTVELPIRLVPAPALGEHNRNFRALGSVPWLVPYFGYRFYRQEPTSPFGKPDSLYEVSGGLALRMSYETDFL